ncbi:hypothetical protein [Streptomyces sp. NBC_00690]|nr:hypothetical protein [Streptomyces sp. NBC_00690]
MTPWPFEPVIAQPWLNRSHTALRTQISMGSAPIAGAVAEGPVDELY